MATRRNRRQRKARVPKHAIRVVPTRRKQIDPDMIAMAYWMIAKRRVEERKTGETKENLSIAKNDGLLEWQSDVVADSPGYATRARQTVAQLLRGPHNSMYTKVMNKHDDNSTSYHGVLLEDIQKQVGRMSEAMADVPGKVTNIDERLARVESNVAVIKAVVTDQSKLLDDHQTDIAKLKAAA